MCNIEDGFKLCSCNMIDLLLHPEKIKWKIYRINHNKRAVDIVGDIATPLYFEPEKTTLFILKELNTKNIFDFNYEPKDEDILEINTKVDDETSKPLYFTYNNLEWHELKDSNFYFYDSRYEVIKKGKIKNQ